jgi:hypothetical protein
MKDHVEMIPASANDADVILVLKQSVEAMKSKGWTIKGEAAPKPTPKPIVKKDTV